MARRPGCVNAEWETKTGVDFTWEQVAVEVLMDIRAELRTLNRLLGCPNFTGIPAVLRGIRKNTMKRKRTPRS